MNSCTFAAVLPDGDGGFALCPELMTEDELVEFLRIPKISKADDYGNVVANLKRMHDLPCIHICKQLFYPLAAVGRWIEDKLQKEQNR
jgi:hypothetical protein